MPVRPVLPALGLSLALLLAACGAAPDASRSAPDAPEATGLAGFERALADALPAPEAPRLGASALGCPTSLAVPYEASSLDLGVYWSSASTSASPNGVGCKARPDGAAIPGFYDPQKPVVLFVHGWQPNSVKDGAVAGTTQSAKRDGLFFREANFNPADAWLAAGWNVAVYHWTQLADDEGTAEMPYHAQAKIWTAGYTYRDTLGRTQDIRMRYRLPDGSYARANMPTRPAGQLFADAYRSALSQYAYTGPEGVRVVGHSLGGQMALALAAETYADPALAAFKRPKRVVLADPYWTPATPSLGHTYGFLAPDANPAERARRIVAALKPQGAVFEWIKSSRLNDLGGDNNTALWASVSRTEVFPEYVFDWNPASGLSRKHAVAPRWYFWSRAFAPRNLGTNAANDLARATAAMNTPGRFDQAGGRGTATPGDDTFVANP